MGDDAYTDIAGPLASDTGILERIGYLCIQGYPKRICSGCTSACREPLFAYPRSED